MSYTAPKLAFIYLTFVTLFACEQLYVDVVEGSTMTAPKLCKHLADHGVLLFSESSSRSVSSYNYH